MNTSQNYMSSSSLEGEEVKNPEGEDLGNIKDFVIDCDTGRVVYAVLSYGGVLGMGDKLFAVPMTALKLDTDDKCFRLNTKKEELKDAPGFDKSKWPDMADRRWGTDIHRYYKTLPYWER
jgi:sporulation protein YlmC with PRC-barrel domain